MENQSIIIASGLLSHSFPGLDSHCLQAPIKNVFIIKVTAIVKLWNCNWAEKAFKSSYCSMLQQLQTQCSTNFTFQEGDTFSQYSAKLVAITGQLSKSLVWYH